MVPRITDTADSMMLEITDEGGANNHVLRFIVYNLSVELSDFVFDRVRPVMKTRKQQRKKEKINEIYTNYITNHILRSNSNMII